RRSAGLRPGVSGARPCRGAGPEVGAPEAVTRRASSLVSLAILLLSILQVLAGPPFVGAPEPAKPPKDSPLTAEEELAAFTVPPGFQIELVAAEPDGGKFVAISFDHAGRMWTMTAFEYPLDANETPAEARALFAGGGR